jgi:hypothetical protein
MDGEENACLEPGVKVLTYIPPLVAINIPRPYRPLRLSRRSSLEEPPPDPDRPPSEFVGADRIPLIRQPFEVRRDLLEELPEPPILRHVYRSRHPITFAKYSPHGQASTRPKRTERGMASNSEYPDCPRSWASRTLRTDI